MMATDQFASAIIVIVANDQCDSSSRHSEFFSYSKLLIGKLCYIFARHYRCITKLILSVRGVTLFLYFVVIKTKVTKIFIFTL